ncbi:MAG: SVM family protein ['Conium maculatum' witches'-broom phytoplasma]|nr:SVM family protein ['Conium maculatum' witches'-broom phytoplasma]
MFQSKNQFKTFYFCLITVIGLLFIFNNHQLMAMNNNTKKNVDSFDTYLNYHLGEINDKIFSISYRKQQLFMLQTNVNSIENRATYNILSKRYYKYVLLIKNLEQQQNLIYELKGNRQHMNAFRNIPEDLLNKEKYQLEELKKLVLIFNQNNI